MSMIFTSNIDAIQAQFEQALTNLPQILTQVIADLGEEIRQQCQDAAPRGAGQEGTPPAGDTSGRLAESFSLEQESDDTRIHVIVRTSQPQKLEYVRYGTGIFGPRGARIYPTSKKALYWPDADHPVRSVSGEQPNDFITPIVQGTEQEGISRIETALDEVAASL